MNNQHIENINSVLAQLRSLANSYLGTYRGLLNVVQSVNQAFQYHVQSNGSETFPIALIDLLHAHKNLHSTMEELNKTLLTLASQSQVAVNSELNAIKQEEAAAQNALQQAQDAQEPRGAAEGYVYPKELCIPEDLKSKVVSPEGN